MFALSSIPKLALIPMSRWGARPNIDRFGSRTRSTESLLTLSFTFQITRSQRKG
jgi:hypothetical protein